jgi:Mitochondrial ribosomal subunit S27
MLKRGQARRCWPVAGIATGAVPGAGGARGGVEGGEAAEPQPLMPRVPEGLDMKWLEAVKEPSGPLDVTFPPLSAGARVLGALSRPAAATEAAEDLKARRAAVFNSVYQREPLRTGRSALKRLIRGPKVMDYYLDAHDDPLMVNKEGQAKQAERDLRNARGFKRRRPQKKAAKGDGKKKRR